MKDSFDHHITTIMNKVKLLCSSMSSEFNEDIYSPHIRTIDSIVVDILQFLLPPLRIASVIKLRLMKTAQIPPDFPITVANFYEVIVCRARLATVTIPFQTHDYYKEFENLCQFLNLPLAIDAEKSPLESIANLMNNCQLVTKYRDFDHFADVSISDAFIQSYVKEKNSLIASNEFSLVS